MEQPTINAQDIAHFHTLFSEFKALQEKAGTEIDAAKFNQDDEITIARDGKAVVVRERDLWDEVWHLGPNCDAGKILSEKYPSPFTVSAQAEEKKKEFQAFAKEKWNVDPLAMSLSDIIRIVGAVVDYKLANRP